jgi:hypothetical protein
MEIRRDDLPEHLAADLRELLAEDSRVSEQGLDVTVDDDCVTVQGVVATDERRRAVGSVLAERLPGRRIDNRVSVMASDQPPAPEVIP